eukprot:4409996-Amphidinium_carterae.1
MAPPSRPPCGLDRQGRRHAHCLLSEFAKVVSISAGCAEVLDVVKWFPGLGAYGKVLDSQVGEHGTGLHDIKVAVLRSPAQWVQDAATLQHPFDDLSFIDEDVAQAVRFVARASTHEVLRFRSEQLMKYKRLAEELELEEVQARSRMHDDVRAVTQGKNFTLLARMMADARCNDCQLAENLRDGMRITGQMPDSGEFDTKFIPAEMDVEVLHKMAPGIVDQVSNTVGPSMDAEIANAVEVGVRQELDKGWLVGPYSKEELTRLYGPWVCNKRFGIKQGRKCRMIDDFSISLVNSTVGTYEKVSLDTTDATLGMAKLWRREVSSDGIVPLLHGKCYDLKSAYRQIAISPADARYSVIAAWYKGAVRYFRLLALPFGARGSVSGFLRVSKALKTILVRLFCVPTSAYFDDFSCIAPEGLQQSTDEVVTTVFGLLGWELSADKEVAFAPSFTALGVVLDFSCIADGVIHIRNKESRVTELMSAIDGILASGFLAPPEAATLRGRVVFAEGQHYARLGLLSSRVLGKRAHCKGHVKHLDSELVSALQYLRQVLVYGKDREVHTAPAERVALVFTDGAAEGDSASVGGLLFLQGETPRMFSESVPKEVIDAWRADGTQHVVYFAELLPVLIAKLLWKRVLGQVPALYFIDNEAARSCFAAAGTRSHQARAMLVQCLEVESEYKLRSWYCRIPSA